MTINLYYNSAESKKIDKTESLTLNETITGTLRTPTSVINPIIIIQHPLSDTLESNYAYIPEFSRYYFITSVSAVNDKLTEITLQVDVLYSFKDSILNLNAFVTRNENTYDNMITDDMVIVKADTDTQEFVITGGTTSFNPNLKTHNVVMSLVSEDADSVFPQITSPVANVLPTISGTNICTSATGKFLTLNPTAISKMSTNVYYDDALNSYIKSIIAYPFEVAETNIFQATRIRPDEDLHTPVWVGELVKPYSDYLLLGEITTAFSNFRDYEPYTTYELYLPYVGWINLRSSDIRGTIKIYYVPDYNDGSAVVLVINTTRDLLIYQGTCQLGVKLSLSTTNNLEYEKQNNANTQNLILNGLTSAVGVGVGIATGNVLSAVGGAMNLAKSIASYTQANASNVRRASGVVNNGVAGVYSPYQPRLRITRLNTSLYDTNYGKYYGFPLDSTRKLSTLTGFTQVGNIHLEDINCLETERDLIESLLTTGVII